VVEEERTLEHGGCSAGPACFAKMAAWVVVRGVRRASASHGALARTATTACIHLRATDMEGYCGGGE